MVTRPTGRDSEIVVVAPAHCPNGHPLRPPNVQVFSQRRGGEVHICWRCWICEAVVSDDEVG